MLYVLGTILGLAVAGVVGTFMESFLSMKSGYDSYDEIPHSERHKY